MSLRRHSWTLWVPYERYTDTSWGDSAPSTTLIRRCRKCGLIKTKHRYGVVLPIDEGAIEAVMEATYERQARKRRRRAERAA